MIDKRDYSLLKHNTFGIQATAARYVEYDSEAELICFITSGQLTTPFLHIGCGSNLLFTDDYRGTILHSHILGINVIEENDDEVLVRVGAGVLWDDFVAYCVAHQWYGVENLSLIPGEVGAGAVQNIGAYGAEYKDVVCRVETVHINGERRTYDVSECCYSYRDSIFKRPAMKDTFVTYVIFHLAKHGVLHLDYGSVRAALSSCAKPTLSDVRDAIISIRRAKLPDPQVTGNAGSFFMNPVVDEKKFKALQSSYPTIPFYPLEGQRYKIPAGWLIEQCGWKGKSLGRTGVHDKQALVLVNLGGATGADVVALSKAVRQAVSDKFGIDIHPEVNFI
jgi:UDP-N-acetylmuramate dehydrogenase